MYKSLLVVGVALFGNRANAFSSPYTYSRLAQGTIKWYHGRDRGFNQMPVLRMTSLFSPNDDSIDKYVSETLSGGEETISEGTLALGGFALVLFGAVSWFLQENLNQPCLADANICTTEVREYAEFFQDHPFGSFMLILTHAIPFVLIPTTMRFVSDKGPLIKKDHPSFNPFVMQLGLATICFGLAFEFGWHVADSWYYANDFHILNFSFYFFLISSFALWADGFENTKRMDAIFAAILLVATVLYPLGAEQASQQALHPEDPVKIAFLEDPNSAKIPLYAGLTVTFTSLTQRGWKVFGPRMGLVFFFSVIVNLVFIFFLQGLPSDTLDIKNYIYHICHDLLGTEAGVAYFAYLVASYTPKALNAEPN